MLLKGRPVAKRTREGGYSDLRMAWQPGGQTLGHAGAWAGCSDLKRSIKEAGGGLGWSLVAAGMTQQSTPTPPRPGPNRVTGTASATPSTCSLPPPQTYLPSHTSCGAEGRAPAIPEDALHARPSTGTSDLFEERQEAALKSQKSHSKSWPWELELTSSNPTPSAQWGQLTCRVIAASVIVITVQAPRESVPGPCGRVRGQRRNCCPLFDDSHSDGCEATSLWGFAGISGMISDAQHLFICLCVFFGKMSIQILCPFLFCPRPQHVEIPGP